MGGGSEGVRGSEGGEEGVTGDWGVSRGCD